MATLEPHPLAMERLPFHDFALVAKTRTAQDFLDYRKVPRSRGDGMEVSSSDSPEPGPASSTLLQKDSSESGRDSTTQHVHNKRHATGTGPSVKSKQFAKENNKLAHDGVEGHEKHGKAENQMLSTRSSTGEPVVYKESEGRTSITKKHNVEMIAGTDLSTGDRQEEMGNVFKTSVIERGAEFMESQTIIRELEERNSKLVEEKIKLAVQLGVQTKVNAEIKNLLVASIGEDLENRLEILVQQSAQQTVTLKHWKKMSEEYAEESDRLEIECDVWRTKFLASRMLSDELSSWKATLYARHRQAKQALEKILEERAELQQYLRNTTRSLQSLGCSLKCRSDSSPEGIFTNKMDSLEQSILETASINDCLAQEALELTQQVLPSPSLSAAALILTQSMGFQPCQTVEHTPAERLAIQVLANDVDLQSEEKQDAGRLMKRLGRQYIGHSHRSRLSTNSFRVTFDCCDRCTGPVMVV